MSIQHHIKYISESIEQEVSSNYPHVTRSDSDCRAVKWNFISVIVVVNTPRKMQIPNEYVSTAEDVADQVRFDYIKASCVLSLVITYNQKSFALWIGFVTSPNFFLLARTLLRGFMNVNNKNSSGTYCCVCQKYARRITLYIDAKTTM